MHKSRFGRLSLMWCSPVHMHSAILLDWSHSTIPASEAILATGSILFFFRSACRKSCVEESSHWYFVARSMKRCRMKLTRHGQEIRGASSIQNWSLNCGLYGPVSDATTETVSQSGNHATSNVVEGLKGTQTSIRCMLRPLAALPFFFCP